MTTRVVIVGSATSNGFGGPDSDRDDIFVGAKDRIGDNLNGFGSGGVGDEEQNP